MSVQIAVAQMVKVPLFLPLSKLPALLFLPYRGTMRTLQM